MAGPASPGAARLSAGAGPAPRRAHAPAPRPRPGRPGDRADPAPLRLDGRPAPGRPGDDGGPRELVGVAGDPLVPGRPRDQRRRGALQGPRRPPPGPGRDRRGRRRPRLAGGGDEDVPCADRPGGHHQGGPRRPGGGRPAADRAGVRLRRPAPHRRGARGRAGHGREAGGPVHLQGPGHRRAGRGGPRAGGTAPGRVRRAAGAPRPGLGPAVAALPHRPRRRRRPGGRQDPQPARLPPAPDRVRAHHRPGRRGAGQGAARRGLPGPHLLGRAVHLPLPEPAPPRADPGPAALPGPAAARRPPGRPGGRPPGGHVPLAERQRRARGDPAAAPQPPLGPLAARPLPPPAPRQHRRGLQHLAVLPGHRGPGLPVGLRGRDAAGDRPLLGRHRQLQPGP